MGGLAGGWGVAAQAEVALAVLLRLHLQMVVEEAQQVALEPVYLECRIGLQHLGETVVFQALVVPDLGCLDESDKGEAFPVSPAELISAAFAEQP